MWFRSTYNPILVYDSLLVPRPPRSAGAGDCWIRVCLSVCLSVCQQFLFRARSPILLGGIEWNLAQWKNIYCSCALGYRFYRAAKNVPVGLDRKSRFFLIMGLSYSALDLRHYLEESNKTWHSEIIYIAVVHLGIGFIEQRKMCLLDLMENYDFFNNET